MLVDFDLISQSLDLANNFKTKPNICVYIYVCVNMWLIYIYDNSIVSVGIFSFIILSYQGCTDRL